MRFDKPCAYVKGAMEHFREHMAVGDYMAEEGRSEMMNACCVRACSSLLQWGRAHVSAEISSYPPREHSWDWCMLSAGLGEGTAEGVELGGGLDAHTDELRLVHDPQAVIV